MSEYLEEKIDVFRRMAGQSDELPEANLPDEDEPEVEEALPPVQKTVRKKTTRGRKPTKKRPVGQSRVSKPEVGITERRPVGLRGIDETPQRKGMRRRWVNDYEDRPQMFREGGYSVAMGQDGQPMTRRSKSGRGPTQILMEIDENLYNADQEKKYEVWNKDAQERLKPREGAGYYQPKTKRY